jgi:hypothetical protein
LALSIVPARLDDPAVAALVAASELELDGRYEALALYRGAGFEPIPCWGPYETDPRSRCFELALIP